jgi:hypothetical protein
LAGLGCILFLLLFFPLTAAFAIRGAGAAITANARLAGASGAFIERHAALAFIFSHFVLFTSLSLF